MRIIPNNRDAAIELAIRAQAGAQALGTIVGLAQNTAARLTTDLHDLIGEPGSAINTGKQGQYNLRRIALTDAQAARNTVITDGRTLCSRCVDALKSHLGRTWNMQWQAAGFSRFSIATSKAKPVPVLLELRNYYRDHPTREVVAEGLTAAACDAGVTTIQSAEQARDAAKSDFADAGDARDASLAQLRRRLIGLRTELETLLSDSDNRWLDFGFSRPIDGKMPTPVTGLVATAGLPGMVMLSWVASTRAVDYRVSWLITGSGAEPTEVGLFTDRAVNIGGLTTGANITVRVTARNEFGETAATEAAVVVP